MVRDYQAKRREVVLSGMAGVGSIVSLPNIVTSRSRNTQQDEEVVKNLKDVLIKRYGREGKIAFSIVVQKYNQYKKGEINRKEFNREVENSINKDPRLEEVKNDYSSYEEEKPVWYQEELESTNRKSTRVFGRDEVDDYSGLIHHEKTGRVLENDAIVIWDNAVADGGSRMGGVYESSVDYRPRMDEKSRARARSSAYLYGSAWSYVRIPLFWIHEDGQDDYLFSVEYELIGEASTGGADVNLIKRYENQSIEVVNLHSPIGDVDGTYHRSTTFTEPSDESVSLTLELYTEAKAGGGAGGADLESGRNRGMKINSVTTDPL